MTQITRWKLLSLGLVLGLAAAACGGDDTPATTTAAPTTTAAATTTAAPTTMAETTTTEMMVEELSLVFFASSSQNGYNQATYKGVERAAEEAGNVVTEMWDGEFNAEVQFNQVEDAVASERFDGYVIVPNDPVGIAPAIVDALQSGPVATSLFPIGPDLDSIQPQVDGIITSAGQVSVSSADSANMVVDYCADKDPCRVIIMIGQLQFPFDNLRLQTFQEVLGAESNIEVLAVGEGNYSQDQSLTVMQDLLQAHPEFEVLLSNADQHVSGAVVALQDAGMDIEPMYISGGGASQVAIDGINSGLWDASMAFFPETEGYLAAKNVIAKLRGESFEDVNDVNVVNDLGVSIVTADVLAQNPNWVAEWEG